MDYLDMTDAEREAWWEWYKFRLRRKRRYSGPKGVPIPGIGKRRYRRGGGRRHKIPAYARPRKGGGRKHSGEESWRHGHTGPLE